MTSGRHLASDEVHTNVAQLTSSTGVGTGKRRQVDKVLDTEDLGLSLVERKTDGASSR